MGKGVKVKNRVRTGVRVGVTIWVRVGVRVRIRRARREIGEKKKKTVKKRTKCFYLINSK